MKAEGSTTLGGHSCLSVIIPTLWKVSSFPERVSNLADCSVVREVLVVDNNPSERPPLHHPRIQILSEGHNIYVNPAWNLAVAHASGELICLLNDDINATPELLEYGTQLLLSDHRHKVGIIGMEWRRQCMQLCHHRVHWRSNAHFGAAIFLRRTSYRPIPDEMKIWWGDDYLLLHTLLSGKAILEISGLRSAADAQFSTSINSNRSVFQPILDRDTEIWENTYRRQLRKDLLRLRPFNLLRTGFTRAIALAKRLAGKAWRTLRRA